MPLVSLIFIGSRGDRRSLQTANNAAREAIAHGIPTEVLIETEMKTAIKRARGNYLAVFNGHHFPVDWIVNCYKSAIQLNQKTVLHRKYPLFAHKSFFQKISTREKTVNEQMEACLPGKYDYVVVNNCLNRGGSDLTALVHLNFLVTEFPKLKIALITTGGSSKWLYKVPKNIRAFEFGLATKGLKREKKVRLLTQFLVQKSPLAIQNNISHLMWEALRDYGPLFQRNKIKIISNQYCVNYWLPTMQPMDLCYAYTDVAHKQTDIIVADNQKYVSHLRSKFGLKNSRAVYTPVTVAFEKPSTRKGRDTFKVLWAGRFDPQKRMDILYQIARMCPDFQFYIYGCHSYEGTQYFEVDELKKLSNVKICGGFDNISEIPINKFDVFLYTSAWDGLPNVLLEMTASGLPIVASNAGGVGEFINEKTGYLVSSPADISEYVIQLKRIKSNPLEARKRVLKAQQLVRERHCYQHFKKDMMSVFESIGLDLCAP